MKSTFEKERLAAVLCGQRLTALDRFARGWPEAASTLEPGRSAMGPRDFGARFFTRLDRLIRDGIVGEELAETLAGLSAVLEGSCRTAFLRAFVTDASRLTRARFSGHKVRSLWGVTPIVNLIPAVEADRRAGIDSESVVWTTYYIEGQFNVVLKEQQEWVARTHPQNHVCYSWLAFLWALLSYDVFFYFNDRGLVLPAGGYGSDRFGINLQEMQLLKVAGKRLITLAYGADYRTRERTISSSPYNFCMHCPEVGKFCVCDDEGAARMFETIEQHATVMLGWGLSAAFLPNPRVTNYLALDVEKIEPQYPDSGFNRPLEVLHSPNHSHFKGTRYLEAAVKRLQAEGCRISLRILSGVSNREVREALRTVDVVADQFIGGNYGYAAIEAMATGKPVLCYIRDREVLPSAQDCPIIEANPETLYETLRDVVVHRDRLPEIGRQSRRYVEKHHSIDHMREELSTLYGEIGVPPFNSAWQSWVSAAKHYLRRAYYYLDELIGRRFSAPFAVRVPGSSRSLKDYVNDLRRRVGIAAATGPRLPGILLRRTGELVFPVVLGTWVKIARAASVWRIRAGTPRSVWGTTPILTLSKLASCDRLLGLRSRSLVHTNYYVTSNFDINLKRISEWLLARWPRSYSRFYWLVLGYTMLRFDVFHYFCDRGVLLSDRGMGINQRELEILKAAGKRVYTYTYGADVRTRETTRALGPLNFCLHCPEPNRYCICNEDDGRFNVETIQRFATGMNVMGDMCAYVPGGRVLHFWPLDLSGIRYAGVSETDRGTLRVGHAPNHPFFKGTRYLEAAVDQLQREGLDVELVRIQGVSNEAVLDMLASVDVVAEQFIGGFHGYTALEAMALGKPVICYIHTREWLADPATCPIINGAPDTLAATLRTCLANRDALVELGVRGRRYVERYYSLQAVAANLGRMYLESGRFPARVAEGIRREVDSLEAGLPEPPATFNGEIASIESTTSRIAIA